MDDAFGILSLLSLMGPTLSTDEIDHIPRLFVTYGPWTCCNSMKRNLKRKKFQLEILAKLEEMPLDLMVSDEPTNWIIALNCSYDSMIDGAKLEELFCPFAGFKRVEMFLGAKPYSFVEFQDPSTASVAFDSLDGYKSQVVNKVVLLAYAKELPKFPPKPIQDPIDFQKIPGLELVLDIVSADQEQHLIQTIIEQGEMGRWEILNKRSVQHYGYRFDYPLNDVDRNAIDITESSVFLPTWCDDILERYLRLFPDKKKPDQLTMNRYTPGDGIAYHCDRHSSFDSPILIFSLGSDIVMEFKSVQEEIVSAVLPARSLLIIDGEARFGWEHVIRPRKVDLIQGKIIVRQNRWSLTFRNVRRSPCVCGYPSLCD